MTFDPGRLEERVKFEARKAEADGYGNSEQEFDPATAVERWALFLMRPGSEAVIDARLTGVQPVDVVVRRDRGVLAITAEWRMTDLRTGEVYDVTAPPADMDRSRQWLTISCARGKNP